MVTRNRYRTDCAPSTNSDQATNTCRWCPWTWTSYCGNARRTDQTAFEVMPVNRVLMNGIIARVSTAFLAPPLSFTLIQLVWEQSNEMFFPDHSWIYILLQIIIFHGIFSFFFPDFYLTKKIILFLVASINFSARSI